MSHVPVRIIYVYYYSAAKTRQEMKFNAFNTYCKTPVPTMSPSNRSNFYINGFEREKKVKEMKKESSTTQFALLRAVVPNSRCQKHNSITNEVEQRTFYRKSTFSS